MSTVRAYTSDPYADNHHSSRTRSTSTGSRASSSRSSSSQESGDSLDRARRSSQTLSPPPKTSKSGSFSRFFGTKEPSLDSFKQLAELQQKELERKGQKLPFGVPSAKLPSSVKDDYKKAKQRAKENAKMHELMSDRLKQQGRQERQGHVRRSSSSSQVAEDDHSRPGSGSPHTPSSPRSIGNKRFSALEPLPEASIAENMGDATRSSVYHTSRPISREHQRGRPQPDDLLTGHARKEALPWE